ncbi:MAG TPA: sugar kinase [Cytophagales bacterium]|nr:sugar kinase [Cytophagales bacterium]
MGNKILSFGELLLRMSPKTQGGWIEENSIATYVGGAELNVATALGSWDVPSKYFTALPDHALSDDLLQYMKQKNIDPSAVQLSGSRIGIYYLPQGSDLKNAGVIYDRAYSSFSELKPGSIDWDAVLSDVSWLHFTAISPALNQQVADLCLEMLKAASDKGITISLDLNFRAKLWKYGKAPVAIMPQLASYCDLIMGNIWAAGRLLGMPLDETVEVTHQKSVYLDHALATSEAIVKSFPKVKHVANTFRFDSSTGGIDYYATLYTGAKLHVSEEINAVGIKDKIGSGDCFMAGLIYGFYKGLDPEQTLEFATCAAVGKMYETSDATSQNATDVWSVKNKLKQTR